MYIIDFEASSLSPGSYPIEVAWGDSLKTVTSYLLNPVKMKNWTDWSSKSCGFHGITRDRLLQKGRDPKQVARQMIEALAGKPVYSDEPRFDTMWKDRLLIDSGYDPTLIRIKNLKYFLNKLIKTRSPGKRLVDLFQEFSAITCACHRAGPDVMWLLRFVEFIKDIDSAGPNGLIQTCKLSDT